MGTASKQCPGGGLCVELGWRPVPAQGPRTTTVLPRISLPPSCSAVPSAFLRVSGWCTVAVGAPTTSVISLLPFLSWRARRVAHIPSYSSMVAPHSQDLRRGENACKPRSSRPCSTGTKRELHPHPHTSSRQRCPSHSDSAAEPPSHLSVESLRTCTVSQRLPVCIRTLTTRVIRAMLTPDSVQNIRWQMVLHF